MNIYVFLQMPPHLFKTTTLHQLHLLCTLLLLLFPLLPRPPQRSEGNTPEIKVGLEKGHSVFQVIASQITVSRLLDHH